MSCLLDLKPGDRVDIFWNGKWESHPNFIVKGYKQLVRVAGTTDGESLLEKVRLHIPEPKVGASVKLSYWNPFTEPKIQFCKFVGSLDVEGVRVWTAAYRFHHSKETSYVTEPAEKFEVVQE